MLMPHTLNVGPKGILHLGANTGEELPLYIAQPSIQKVVWFECNQMIVPYLKDAVEAVPGHYVIPEAVCECDNKDLEFHLTNNGASSSILELGEHKNYYPNIVETKVQKLKGFTTDTLLKKYGFKYEDFDFVNLDLQGAELLAMQGMLECLKHLKWVYTEVNFKELYKGCALISDIDSFLAKLGFERKLLADTELGWGDAFYAKS